MPDDKPYTAMSPDELRAALNEYNARAKTEEPLPLPAGAPPGMTDAQKVTLNDNWLTHIWGQPSQTWTPAEAAAIRFAAAHVLREMQ
jgi:hypothetical protein